MNPFKSKLLIVDESEAMRSKLREHMRDLGFVRIDDACDARAALTLIQSDRYDLVLCEWNSAPFNGLELVRAVRQGSVARQTPFLLISDDGSARRTVEALEAGANGLLLRPFSESRLGEKVMRIVTSHAAPLDAARAQSAHREDTWLPSR